MYVRAILELKYEMKYHFGIEDIVKLKEYILVQYSWYWYYKLCISH